MKSHNNNLGATIYDHILQLPYIYILTLDVRDAGALFPILAEKCLSDDLTFPEKKKFGGEIKELQGKV